MEGRGDGATTRHGGPRGPQPPVMDAPQSAALGQAMIAFRMSRAPSMAGADAAQATRKRRISQGAERDDAAADRWLISAGVRICLTAAPLGFPIGALRVGDRMQDVQARQRMPDAPWLASYPSGVDWSAEFPAMPLWDLFDQAVGRYADRPCLDFLGRPWSYRQVGRLVDRAAAGLQALGVGAGTKVGLFLPNCPYFVICFFAVLKAGGTVVSYNPLYAEREIAHQIEDSETDLMVTLDLARAAAQARADAGAHPAEGDHRRQDGGYPAFPEEAAVPAGQGARDRQGAGRRPPHLVRRSDRQWRRRVGRRCRIRIAPSPRCSTPAAPPACPKARR